VRLRLSALLASALSLGAWGVLRAEEPLPPPPQAHFNDYAGLVSAADAQRLDAKLADFEKQTSTQIVVAIFPKLPSPSLEDFTVRTAESWKVGQKGLHNGAVLFLFVSDRKLRIETGYGLEGALPDTLASRILDERVKPRFAQGDWTGGLEAGIDGIMAATRGEYQAAAAPRRKGGSLLAIVILVVFALLFLLLVSRGGLSERSYSSRGWRGGGWGGGGGGGWGGGGGGGGGGSFGGGGASSSW
jgi:uncharacterized protein